MGMQIGELAQRVGVSPDTIRFYEKQGLLDDSLYSRHANNYRMYGEAAVERVLLIKQAKRFGFTLRELRHVGERWQTDHLSHGDKIRILEDKVQQLEQQMQELVHLKSYVEAKLDGLRTEHHAAPHGL
jgi:MerR family Zn(II)-responsive transcriptional regulator of zntA